MAFKITMVLGGIRSNDELVVCRDDDFQTAMTLVETYLKHSVYLLNQIKGTGNQISTNQRHLKKWISNHPEFKRAEFCNYAKSLGISDRTVSDILKRFVHENELEKIKQGYYRRT
jgi:hypothetical protein